jgi:hypothetical protein
MILLFFLLITAAVSSTVSNSVLAVNVKKTSQYITSSQDTVIAYDTLETPSIGTQDFVWNSGVATCSSSGFYLIYVEISFLDSNAQTTAITFIIDGIAQNRRTCAATIALGSQSVPVTCSFTSHVYINTGQTLDIQLSVDYDTTIKSKFVAYKTSVV